ncbi:hypothetical protein AVM02_08085 [Brucella anthropi]
MIVQVPGAIMVREPIGVIVQTLVVAEENTTGKPDVESAVNVGVAPKLIFPGFGKLIVCFAIGVKEIEGVEAGPVPELFLATTVKLYAVPLVRPVTVIGLPGAVAAKPPGLDVTV